MKWNIITKCLNFLWFIINYLWAGMRWISGSSPTRKITSLFFSLPLDAFNLNTKEGNWSISTSDVLISIKKFQRSLILSWNLLSYLTNSLLMVLHFFGNKQFKDNIVFKNILTYNVCHKSFLNYYHKFIVVEYLNIFRILQITFSLADFKRIL